MGVGFAVGLPSTLPPSRQPADDGQHDHQHADAQRQPADALDDPLTYRRDKDRADGSEPHARREAAARASAVEPNSPPVAHRS